MKKNLTKQISDFGSNQFQTQDPVTKMRVTYPLGCLQIS
jgi:hypothetical protein